MPDRKGREGTQMEYAMLDLLRENRGRLVPDLLRRKGRNDADLSETNPERSRKTMAYIPGVPLVEGTQNLACVGRDIRPNRNVRSGG